MRTAFAHAARACPLVLLACAGIPTPSPQSLGPYAALGENGLLAHAYAAPRTRADRYVLLLPGSSGLRVFDDDTHYFRAATKLDDQGLFAIVVDYRAAWHASAHPDLETTGDKIAWVAEQVVAKCKQLGVLDESARGAVVAWSLGAEGLISLFESAERCEAMRLDAAVAFYPANEEERAVRAATPLLVLTGELDDVTPIADLRQHLILDDRVELQVFPDAHHGFDIESIVTPRRISLLPWIGPHATFAANDAARSVAYELMLAFLATHVH